MLHLCHKPEALLLRDQIISKVELLELNKVCVFVKHLSVECREFVSRKREPFKLHFPFHYITNDPENYSLSFYLVSSNDYIKDKHYAMDNTTSYRDALRL